MRQMLQNPIPIFLKVGLLLLLAFEAQPLFAQTLTLVFPQIAVGDGFTTTITLVHSDERSTAAATGTITFYNPDGTLRTVTTNELGTSSSFNVTVPYQGVLVLTLASTDPLAVGSAKYVGTGVAVQGIATFRTGSTIVGGLAAPMTNRAWVLIESTSGFGTGVAITNPGVSSINITLSLRDSNGAVTETSNPPELNPMVPDGHYAKFIGTEMGFSSSGPQNGSLEIMVNGAGSFSALPLNIANDLISSSALITAQADAPLIFPQIVDGPGWTTATRLFNPGTSTFTGTMRYFNPDGTPRSITLNRGVNSTFNVSIPPLGTDVLQSTGSSPEIVVGMARLDAQASVGGVSTIFTGINHLGVPPALPMRSGRMAVDTVNGNTGFAVSGTGGAQANISLTLQDAQGGGAQTVSPPELNPLDGDGQFARFVNEVGFSDTAGRADSSVLLQDTASGTFAPLVLLITDGNISSAAIARQVTSDAVTDWAGAHSGQWNNTTFGSSGSITLTITIDVPSQTGTLTMDLGGGVFGGGDPPPETFTGPLTASGGFADTSTSPLFGERTVTVTSDGTISLRAYNVPSAFIAYLTLDGFFTPQGGFTGAYEVGAPAGGVLAVGTWNAN